MLRVKKANVLIVSSLAVGLIGSSFFGYLSHDVSTKRAALDEKTVATKQQLLDATNEQDRLESIGIDQGKMTQQMTTRMVSASNISKELLDMDELMVVYYHSNLINRKTPAKTKKKVLANMEKVWANYERVTGSTDRSPNITFRKNPDWTIQLKSVLPYKESPEVPLLFEMRTKKGEVAGLISATYFVQDKQVRHIKRYYTSVGQRDFVDVGGD